MSAFLQLLIQKIKKPNTWKCLKERIDNVE